MLLDPARGRAAVFFFFSQIRLGEICNTLYILCVKHSLLAEGRILVMPGKKRTPPGFAARLRTYRIERRLSQTDLATAIGTSQRMISNYETSSVQPTAAVLVDLARVLRVSADLLLGLRKLRRDLSPDRKRERQSKLLNMFSRLAPIHRNALHKIIEALASVPRSHNGDRQE
jgi:transcriptional regulator with XRE-family HTH domain